MIGILKSIFRIAIRTLRAGTRKNLFNAVALTRVLLLVIAFGISGTAMAKAETLVIPPNKDDIEAGHYVDVFIDPTGEMSRIEAEKAYNEGRFKRNEGKRLSLGVVNGAAWLHLTVDFPKMHSEKNWMLELSRENMRAVELYCRLPSGIWQHQELGYHLPARSIEVFSRYPVANLPSELSGETDIYIKLASYFALGMQVSIMTREAFHRQQLFDSYLFGLLYGVPLALSLFNLFIFFSLRDRVYLYYVVFVTCMALYQAMIHGQIRLMGLFDPWLENHIHGILISVALFFAGLFTKRFLNTKRYSPFMDKVLTAYMAMAFIRFGLSLLESPHMGNVFSQIMGLVSPIVAISSGAICWKRGFHPARYYVVAWAALSICVVWHVLVSMSILPWIGISSMMMVFGSALEAVLLSFALADRIRLLRREREEAERREQRYKALSMIDGLTGLANRRFLDQVLKENVTRFKRSPLPISVLFMDIDDFKKFNDTYGHAEGDKVLVALADIVSRQVRGNDTPCRYGGEEFVVLMPGASLNDARWAGERIRKSFSEIDFTPDEGPAVRASLSIGAAQLATGESGEELLRRADQALYQAKEQGKNQVVLAA